MNFKLKKKILETGLKQGAIAERAGINQVRFSRIVHESVEAREEEKKAIATILKKPVHDLF